MHEEVGARNRIYILTMTMFDVLNINASMMQVQSFGITHDVVSLSYHMFCNSAGNNDAMWRQETQWSVRFK